MRVLTVLVAIAVLVGIAGCGSTEQEQVWNSFIKAVADKRVDDALGYIDFARMSQKALGDDPDALAATAFLGGPEATAEWMKGLFREALSQSDVEDGAPATLGRMDQPTSVKTEGDFSTLTFNVDGADLAVEMERIDGTWKIVDFGDAFGESGSSAGIEGTAEDQPGGPGRYTSEISGTVVNTDVPAPSDNDLVREIEEYRQTIDAASVSYILVAIDNQNGKDEYYMDSITIVTEDGVQIPCSQAWQVLGDWSDALPLDRPDDNGSELYNKHLNSTTVLPGAVSETVFIATQELSSIKSVWLDGQTQMAKVE
ncbi:MAG: hypothetical protein U1E22_06260 [Coriobacteriia bacterium]|nr:hypothetical protein [Coriobacteriia bacterium]